MNDEQMAELVGRARRGEQEAYGRLARFLWAIIVRSVRGVLRDHHLAQDVAQEALLKAQTRLKELDRNSRFVPWLLRIARNIAVDRLRSERTRPEVELADPRLLLEVEEVREPAPTDTPPAPMASAELWSAVARLSARDSRLLYLRFGRGLSPTQIAEECQLDPDVVKVALHRGRSRLSAILAGDRPG